MGDSHDLTPIILQNMQDDLADMRDRLTEFERRMEARWEATVARWDATDARVRVAESELASWRDRFAREQAMRERNARRTLELFDALIRKVTNPDPAAP